jgi:hypothetical protein
MKNLTTTTLLLISLSSTTFADPNDKALSVIEKITEENREKGLPPLPKKSGFGVSFEFGIPHP